jgi:hypothetical protein
LHIAGGQELQAWKVENIDSVGEVGGKADPKAIGQIQDEKGQGYGAKDCPTAEFQEHQA